MNCPVGITLPAKNSLILQSYKSKERKEPLNGDGLGVGWYSPAINEPPCVFTSITPAWSNENLRRLSERHGSNVAARPSSLN
jgi:glutamine amidotransferase